MNSFRLSIATFALLMTLAAGCGSKNSGPMEPYLAGPPLVFTINGASKPSGPTGSTVIIEGVNFGAFRGSGKVVFSDGRGGGVLAPLATASDWTNDFIVAAVPSGAETGPVMVQTAAGISNSLNFTVTQNATFSPSAISWTASTPLPVGLSGHAAVYVGPPGGGAGSYIYVLGGADNTGIPRTYVQFASVQSDGHVGTWNPAASLPRGVAFHAAVVATPYNSATRKAGFLYVLGGATNGTGQPSNAIYRGELNPDGTVVGWTLAGSLPVAIHSFGATIFHGSLYIAGGATTGNTPSSGVYRAQIDTTGALGIWQTMPSLPAGRSYQALLSFGGHLYTLGGESAAVAPNDPSNTGTMVDDVTYAKIDLRTGNLTTPQWSENSTKLTKAASKHTAVLGGGYILVSAGIYNGAKSGSSEESYAQIGGDGSVSSFNGATGSHTIFSAGGKCLFNHAAVSYTDASGVAHILVIGGDDVNAPGMKRAETWFY